MPIDPLAADALDSWHSDEIPMFEERAISLSPFRTLQPAQVLCNLPVQVLFERYGPRVSGDEGRFLIRALIQSGLFVRFFRAVASWRQGGSASPLPTMPVARPDNGAELSAPHDSQHAADMECGVDLQ